MSDVREAVPNFGWGGFLGILFKPLTLLHGPAMSNRFMMAPLTSQQSEFDGTASEYDQFWIKQLAQSGYALIQTSAATVEAGGIAFERQLGIHSDDHLPGLTSMARAIRERGALSAVQLHHAAKRAQLAGFDGVSVHGAFGWILSEFLSPNQRPCSAYLPNFPARVSV